MDLSRISLTQFSPKINETAGVTHQKIYCSHWKNMARL